MGRRGAHRPLPTVILGAVLALYASAGILSETVLADSAQAERVLCRCLLCTNARLVRSAREHLTGAQPEDLQGAIGTYRTVLQRDPHNPNRWSDLGEALLEAGRTEEARYCYQRVRASASTRGWRTTRTCCGSAFPTTLERRAPGCAL